MRGAISRHRADLAVIERREQLRRDALARVRAESISVERGLAETRTLGEARGEAFEHAPAKRGEGRKPMRRLTGLEWLHRKGRITEAQRVAGLRYGASYRRALGEARLRSALDREPQGVGQALSAVLASAEASAAAHRRLAIFRARLFGQEDLVRACDLICGQERTPREASANGKGAEGLELVLKVALDLLARPEI